MKNPKLPGARGARLAAVLLALAAAAGCDDSGTIPRIDNQIVLGGVFSLTGNWASLGVTSKAAMELAVEDVNAYASGRGVTFRANVRDTRLDPATALAAVQSLREAGVQVVIGPQSSAELAAIKPYVDAHPLLVVSQSSTAGSLAVSGDRIFRFTPADSLEGVAISALMWGDGIRAMIPIWRADTGNQGLHTATAARMSALGATSWTGVEYAAAGASYAAAVASLGTQVRQALAIHPAAQVGVYLAGFDEVADVFAAAASDPVLASVRWYGADGIAQSPFLLTRPAAVSFAETVGFPSPVFGLDPSAAEKWQPVAARIQARAGAAPDAFALGVYDAVWVAAEAYLAAPRPVTIDGLTSRFEAAADAYYGATGWTALNAAGDRRYANFDFWAIRPVNGTPAWVRVADYDTRAGTLTHP
jgi:branched-chain amino acid transport system substrate-binding protein